MKPVEAGFDWGMFWQAASAIATAFAAIIALWQTRYQNRKKSVPSCRTLFCL